MAESPDPRTAPKVGTEVGDAMLYALRQIPTALRSQDTQDSLMTDSAAAAAEMGLPKEGGPLLLNILNAARAADSAGSQSPAGSQSSDEAVSTKEGEVREMLLEPFGNISWSFRILTAMSIVMFVVGLAFLIVALVQAATGEEVTPSTFAIAGLGLADLVLLFYRRPWQDIARGLSNSQQARIVATSYLAGISMLRTEDPEVQEKLQEITRNSIELLEEFTEPDERRQRADRAPD